MPFANGARVIINAEKLTSLPPEIKRNASKLTGRILQRCGPEAYDVSLDEPLSPEVTFLSWVPEHLLSPADEGNVGGGARSRDTL